MWFPGWKCRKKITINGSSGAGTGYQVLLKVGESAGASGCDFHVEGHSEKFPTDKNDSGDLRFTSSNGSTLLDLWVEKVEGTSPNRTAYVWVKVADSLDSDVDIYCYYRNVNATNASNGDNTFLFFDDFDDGNLDTTKWTWIRESSGNWDEGITQPGWLNIKTLNAELWGTNNTAPVLISYEISGDFEAQVRIQINPTTNYQRGGIFVYSDDDNYVASQRIYGNGQLIQGKREVNASVVRTNINNTLTDVFVKVRKVGTTYTSLYSSDGESWTQIRSDSDINFAHRYIALVSESYSGGGGGLDVLYDDVFVRKYVSPEPIFSLASTEEVASILSGTACDKNGNVITGESVKVFILEKETGEKIGQTTSDSNGNWSCDVWITPNTKVVTVLTLEGDYGGDTDIAGAEFDITQEGS